MIKLPYRNHLDFKRNDEILDKKYNNHINIKPDGFWYNIKDSYFKNPTTNFGDYFYEIVLKSKSLSNILNEDKNKILSINNIVDIDIFNKKYNKRTKGEYGIFTYIDWGLVSNNYGGFEIKNYEKILKVLRKEKTNFNKYSWLYTFDFSSGCVWNLNIIKEKNFIKKLTEEEMEELED